MSEQKSRIKKYQLIKFIGEPENEATELAIDRIPCRWVRYDVEVGHTVAKFPPPPYTAVTYKSLEKLIRTRGAPMSSWPEYPVDLVGHADTYKDSIKRLEILQKKPYAFTSDTEVEPHTKAAEIIEELKAQSIEELMKVPAIENEASAKSNSSYDQEYDTDSQTSSEETTPLRRKMKKVKSKGKRLVKPQIQKKKVVKLLHGKSGASKSLSAQPTEDIDGAHFVQESGEVLTEPGQNPIKGAKVQIKVKEHVPQKKLVKPFSGKSGASKSSSAQPTEDIDGAHFVQESREISTEPEQNPIEDAKVQNKVKEHVPQEKLVKAHSNNLGSSKSQSPLTNEDIVGAYFVRESGELVSEAEQHSIERALVFRMEERQAESFIRTPSAFDKSLKKAGETLRQAEKEYTKDTLLLMSTLKGLSSDLKANTTVINNLCAVLQNNKTSVQEKMSRTALVLDSHFDLPFETVAVFKEFDSQLADKKYREHCAAALLFYIDPENHVSKSMTNIIKKFIGRDVAMNFTAIKQTPKKEVFKGMKFYDIMFEVLTSHHTDKQGNPICEKYFNQCLGHALANAKDWDGFRIERAKKEQEKKRLAEGGANKKD